MIKISNPSDYVTLVGRLLNQGAGKPIRTRAPHSCERTFDPSVQRQTEDCLTVDNSS